MGFLENWGNVARVAGLLISIWVLIIAQRARAAAEDARSAARLKSLIEVLAEASSRVQQVGVCLTGQQWDFVQVLAGEVIAACSLVKERWGDSLTETSRENLLQVSSRARSIAGVAGEAHMRQLSKAELRQALDAQLILCELLNTILGEARRVEERR